MIKAIRISVFFSTVLLFLLTSCTSGAYTGTIIYTGNFSNVTQTTATCGGDISSDGGANIIERGVCWSTMPAPTIQANKTSDGTGTGSFASSLINLTPGTTYYVRAYATTDYGTIYANTFQLTTFPDTSAPSNLLNPDLTYGTATDIDGNVYHTITIGTQTWMAENLSVTKYRDGEVIPYVTDNTKWGKLTSGAQCVYYYNSEANSIAKFGRLYNFYAVSDSRNIAPQGWHVASDTEWAVLNDYLAENMGTSTSVAQALATKSDWKESSIPGAVGYLDPDTYTSLNNSSGFSALPAGGRFIYGVFTDVTGYCSWWCSIQSNSTTAWFRSLNYYGINVGRNVYDKHYGLSVRCVKD
jgi:uncharacterized protein (TIGR02145 family)